MKKILHLSLVAAVMLLVWSCANDALVQVPDEPCTTNAPANPYRVSLKEALATADLFLDELDGGKTRKSRQPRSIEYFVQDALTRSGSDADTLLYIVNYADDEGFAILGADRRVKPVYGFSNEGNLDLSDTVNNRGLAHCMQNIRNSTSSAYWGPVLWDTTKRIPPREERSAPGFEDYDVTIIKRINPLLSPNVRRWGQHSNFNAYCPVVNNEMFGSQGIVGCAPLAAAQVMSYYSWPESCDGVALDWESIKATQFTFYESENEIKTHDCPPALAWLLAKIGGAMKAQYFANSAGEPSTSVDQVNLRDGFSKFGYMYIGNPVSFYSGSPSSDLSYGPLLVSGWLPNTYNTVGHTWVVDGYLSYKMVWNAIANEDHTLYYSYYHCVWGWQGQNNGYFNIDSSGVNTTPHVTGMTPADSDDRISGSYTYINLVYHSKFQPIK